MLDKKYYTPQLEEFHLGFECELYKGDTGGDWVKLVVGEPTATGFGSYDADWCADNVDKIRVKHLCREDLKELGFDKCCDPRGKVGTYWNPETYIAIQFHGDKHYVYSKYLMFDREELVFAGKLANKSELKKILQQLGI